MADTSPRPYVAFTLWILVALAISIGGINKLLKEQRTERETFSQYVERCLTPDRQVLRDFSCTVVPSEFQPRLSTPQG